MPNFLQNDCFCTINSGNVEGIRLPIPDAMLSPWVQLIIEDEGQPKRYITTGNISQPENSNGIGTNLGSNFAVIKSFSYGTSNGFEAVFEVVDLEGGNFCNFINKISKVDLDDVALQSEVAFQWGWKTKNCDNTRFRYQSQLHRGNIAAVERDMEGGYYKFTLFVRDFSVIYRDLRTDITYIKKTLKHSLTQLFTKDINPKLKDVLFLQRGSDGKLTQPLQFKVVSGSDSAEEGPKGNWTTDNYDIPTILSQWLDKVTSAKDKAIVPMFVSKDDGQYLIIKEEDDIVCDNEFFPEIQPIRKYIHNGGKKSPVISFNPKVREVFARVSAAGGGFGNTIKPIKQSEIEVCEEDSTQKNSKVKTGVPVVQSINPVGLNMVGQNAPKVAAKADKIARIADVAWAPIQGDLVVQGDPELDGIDLTGSRIGITVILPFKPRASGSTLAWGLQTSSSDSSNCDPLLTSDKYIIKGVSHNISAGSYTTSINVLLVIGS